MIIIEVTMTNVNHATHYNIYHITTYIKLLMVYTFTLVSFLKRVHWELEHWTETLNMPCSGADSETYIGKKFDKQNIH